MLYQRTARVLITQFLSVHQNIHMTKVVIVYTHVNRHTATPGVVPRLLVLPEARARGAFLSTLDPNSCITCSSCTFAISASRSFLKKANKHSLPPAAVSRGSCAAALRSPNTTVATRSGIYAKQSLDHINCGAFSSSVV